MTDEYDHKDIEFISYMPTNPTSSKLQRWSQAAAPPCLLTFLMTGGQPWKASFNGHAPEKELDLARLK